MESQRLSQKLQDIYEKLFKAYGPQHWWPADEPFEVMVGAILTQSAAWVNVEKAIKNLKEAGALSPRALRRLPLSKIAGLIYACGYYNVKAKKLKNFAEHLGSGYGDSLDKLFSSPVAEMREGLLALYGIGPESADSIILYAAGKPVFVIDAYTRRILSRIGISPGAESYDAYQTLFMQNLPLDTGLFNEYHALLVYLGKNVCRRRPLCKECPLSRLCRFALTENALLS